MKITYVSAAIPQGELVRVVPKPLAQKQAGLSNAAAQVPESARPGNTPIGEFAAPDAAAPQWQPKPELKIGELAHFKTSLGDWSVARHYGGFADGLHYVLYDGIRAPYGEIDAVPAAPGAKDGDEHRPLPSPRERPSTEWREGKPPCPGLYGTKGSFAEPSYQYFTQYFHSYSDSLAASYSYRTSGPSSQQNRKWRNLTPAEQAELDRLA